MDRFMTRVLVGIDGSQLALDAARQAVDLFGRDRVEVTLVRVVEPAFSSTTLAAGAPGAAIAVDPSVAEETTEALEREAADDLTAAQSAVGVDTTTQVRSGPPGDVICELADEGSFDLVVVGSHGSGFLKRVLLGSVSHHVLHHAPCPVLVVRSPDSRET